MQSRRGVPAQKCQSLDVKSTEARVTLIVMMPILKCSDTRYVRQLCAFVVRLLCASRCQPGHGRDPIYDLGLGTILVGLALTFNPTCSSAAPGWPLPEPPWRRSPPSRAGCSAPWFAPAPPPAASQLPGAHAPPHFACWQARPAALLPAAAPLPARLSGAMPPRLLHGITTPSVS